MANIVVDNILALLDGKRPPNFVNPEVSAHDVEASSMPRPIIAVTDSPFPSLDPAKAALARVDPELRMAKSASADDILSVARDADAVLVTYAKLPGELLRQLKRCKAIGRFGLGVDNIDLPAAKALGISVNYVPDYCLQEVSDHAMALLLALARKIPLSNKLVQSGRWEVPPIVPLRRLERTGARPRRLRQHPARAGAQGARRSACAS